MVPSCSQGAEDEVLQEQLEQTETVVQFFWQIAFWTRVATLVVDPPPANSTNLSAYPNVN